MQWKRWKFLHQWILLRYVRPPKDLRKDGMLWKIERHCYGINDASRGFWKLARRIFKSLGMVQIPGDEAAYYKMRNGKLACILVTHVDDFGIASSREFFNEMIEALKKQLKISKIEEDEFRFTGIDVKRKNGVITVSMDAYAESIENIKEFRDVSPGESLTFLESKVYRKFNGKLAWLASNARPDLSYEAHMMSKKASKATMADLRDTERIMTKINERKNTFEFMEIGDKRDLIC